MRIADRLWLGDDNVHLLLLVVGILGSLQHVGTFHLPAYLGYISGGYQNT